MSGTPTDEEFAHELRRRLRRSSQPTGGGLDPQRLMRRGRARRRQRRVFGPVLAAVLLLCAAAGVYGVTDRSHNVPAPAAPITAVPDRPSAPATTSHTTRLDLNKLDSGDPSQVGTVQAGVWRPPLKSDPVGLLLPSAHYDGEFVGTGDRLLAHLYPVGDPKAATTYLYASEGDRTKLDIRGSDFARGPKGSVLWRDAASHGHTVVIGRLNTDGSRTSYEVTVKKPSSARFAASANAIFITDGDAVARYPITAAGLGKPERLREFGDVLSGNPNTNTVILTVPRDGGWCSAPVNGDHPWLTWQTCEYDLTSQSEDGKYFYGVAQENGAADPRSAVFSADGTMILDLHGSDAWPASFGRYASFDVDDLLTVVLWQADVNGAGHAAIVTCALDDCHLSTAIRPAPTDGLSPYALVEE